MTASQNTLFLGLTAAADTVGVVRREALYRSGRVVAVDLDLYHGQLASRLGVDGSTSTIVDAAALDSAEIDPQVAAAVCYPAPGRDGLVVVPSPAHPELADILEPRALAALLHALGSRGSLVIDAGSVLTAPVLTACVLAHEVVLVGPASPFSIRQAAVLDDVLRRAGIHAPRSVYVPGARGRDRRRMALACGMSMWRPARRLPRVAASWRRRAEIAASPPRQLVAPLPPEAHVRRR